MTQPDLDRIRAYVTQRLKQELSPRLTYHSVWHTCDEVVTAAWQLATMEGVSGEALMLVITAAYFHDIGFVQQRFEHEAAGIEIARQTLPAFGYSRSQIEAIAGMIQATVIPQRPLNHLEQILADADLDVLGRNDFWIRDRNLRDEVTWFDGPLSDDEWLQRQLAFLRQHHYFTRSARALHESRKQQWVNAISRLLESAR